MVLHRVLCKGIVHPKKCESYLSGLLLNRLCKHVHLNVRTHGPVNVQMYMSSPDDCHLCRHRHSCSQCQFVFFSMCGFRVVCIRECVFFFFFFFFLLLFLSLLSVLLSPLWHLEDARKRFLAELHSKRMLEQLKAPNRTELRRHRRCQKCNGASYSGVTKVRAKFGTWFKNDMDIGTNTDSHNDSTPHLKDG